MKILWFSHIPLLTDKNGKFYYPGGNWISSLKKLLDKDKDIDLGIVFFGKSDQISEDEFSTKYYQIAKVKSNKIKNGFNNLMHVIDKSSDVRNLLRPVTDFKPDVIHVFGTESNLARIIPYTSVPVVIHLQGLIGPYKNAWKIPGLNWNIVLKNMNKTLFLKGYGLYHDYHRFKKMAIREQEYFKTCVNFIGRTQWDRSISRFYSPKSKYFHCDEVMRDSFYQHRWFLNDEKKIIISSTLNADIYKGLDVILKASFLLKKFSKTPFVWNVYGITEVNEYSKVIKGLVKQNFEDNNVVLRGVVLEKELVQELLKSTFFVHTSYMDNSPNSVCEAQLLGLPVISTNVGGISTLIKDNFDGILVPANEPDILVFKILELYNDKEKLNYISENAFNSANRRHNRKKIRKDILSIYYHIMNDKN